MRYQDWQKRFWSEMERQRTARFVWGTRDCVLFSATVADAISDANYVDRARGAFSWTNAREAAALLRTHDLQPLVESVMGRMLRSQQLNMGDIALIVDDDGRQSLGIHDGAQILGPIEVGVQPIPFRCVKGGWHVE